MGDLRHNMLDLGVPALITVGAAIFLVALARGLFGTLRDRRDAVRVPGVITDLRARQAPAGGASAGRRTTQYAPVLEFRTTEGRVVQTESTVSSNPPVGRPGERVQVAYDPADPTSAKVDTVAGTGLLIYLVALPVVALVFVVAAAVLASRLG